MGHPEDGARSHLYTFTDVFHRWPSPRFLRLQETQERGAVTRRRGNLKAHDNFVARRKILIPEIIFDRAIKAR